MVPILTPVEVQRVLETASEREWHVHGIGMLRTYVDEGRSWRLNVWHGILRNPGISTMHDHPWPLSSHVVAGRLRNTRYKRTSPTGIMGCDWMEGKIECGPGFNGLRGEPTVTRLLTQPVENYRPGDWYHQNPEEIHDTDAEDGTITLMHRGPMVPGCIASVFWPVGTEWGDASRRFDPAEAQVAIDAALIALNKQKHFG